MRNIATTDLRYGLQLAAIAVGGAVMLVQETDNLVGKPLQHWLASAAGSQEHANWIICATVVTAIPVAYLASRRFLDSTFINPPPFP